MLDKTLTIILAGGHGSRLKPLTAHRTKPAVPFGGKFRIIDFTLANCLHSGLRQILVLTQYKSHSLQKHLRDGWSLFNPELGEYITVIPPQMRTGNNWYEGTADAVFQNLYMLQRSGADRVLILSGDHIYRMDYAQMLASHEESNATVTLACMQTPIDQAGQFGVVGIDEKNRVTKFEEKPLKPWPIPEKPDQALVSMGIYVFSLPHLIESLSEDYNNPDSSHDFGKDIIPLLLNKTDVNTYQFGGNAGRVSPDRYWRDVGTIDSYYEANMGLLEPVPTLDLYQPDWPIRTHQIQGPPARTVPGLSGNQGIFINSMASAGVLITGGTVHHSILFPGVKVKDNATVENSLLFDGVEIGENSQIRNCIIDKNVVVPAGEQIGFDQNRDSLRFDISPKGVVVIPGGYKF